MSPDNQPKIKPLLIEVASTYEADMGAILQMARAEAQRVFKCEKVKIVDLINWKHGWIAMCINMDNFGSSKPQGVAERVKEL